MKTLAQFRSDDKDFQMLQTSWASVLNPLLRNPLVNGVLLTDIPLVVGDNVINTTLGRKAQGWVMTDITGAAVIYRSAPFDALTLTLNSSAITTIGLMVY